MNLVVKTVIIFLLALWALYAIKPDFFKNNFFQQDTLVVKDYVLTPDPSDLFLEWLRISTLEDYNFKWIAQAIDLYFNALNLFQINIISLLDEANDKKATLKTYLIQLNNILTSIDNVLSNLTSLVSQQEATANMYLQQKQQWDSRFHEWFVEKDTKTILEWLETSYKNWPKYMEYRVLVNAQKTVVWKLQNVRWLLQLKLNLLESYQEDIVTHFDLIKWELLPKLIELKRRLESNHYY